MKQKAIIVDLDGTLCNINHRLKYVLQKPKDWDSFYKHIWLDEINRWCEQLIEHFYVSHDILIVSGRSDEHRRNTISWLNQNCIEYSKVFLRKDGDYRPDEIIKKEIYRDEIEKDYEIEFVVEDRTRVVEMWRSLGLTCLQCAKGDF